MGIGHNYAQKRVISRVFRTVREEGLVPAALLLSACGDIVVLTNDALVDTKTVGDANISDVERRFLAKRGNLCE